MRLPVNCSGSVKIDSAVDQLIAAANAPFIAFDLGDAICRVFTIGQSALGVA